VTGQRTQTLPVAMYTYVREYADPSMAAISTMFIVTTALILIVANRYLGLRRILAIDGQR
jgi:putative spermidine/putrescine transport system permease protein